MGDRISRSAGDDTWHTGHTPPRPLDKIDHAILAELYQDGRMSIRTLADRVHVSRANAYARVNRLLADGVITGFRADIDAERAGLGTSAFVLLTIQRNSWRDVAEALSVLPFVEHYALVGGDVDILTLIRTPSNAELRQLVLERLHQVPGVQSTRTWLIFDEYEGQGASWNTSSHK